VLAEVGKSGLIARAAFAAAREVSFALRRVGVNAGPIVFRRVHRRFGSRMRLWVTGGSKFDPAVGRDLYAMGFNILQAYGLTETSGAATVTTPEEAYLDTVGRPLKGIELAIQPPESAGADGEVAVRGPIVMRGYFNRPDATAAVMRDGWLLTGDLGRLDAHGRLTITGRKKEVIVLASGKNIYPEEVEAQYLRSPYVREICVMGLAEPGEPTTERLHAVVVPNLDLMRERRMVNAGEILRFEMEGLAVDLPPHKRVLGYDVWFEPLPRTTTGKIRRHEVAARLDEARQKRSAPEAAALAPADREWMADPHVARALAAVRARARDADRVRPDANLELDLGLDSMERVELLTDLEQRLAVRVPQEAAHHIFTVRQLVEAVRPGHGRTAANDADASWAVLLRELPPDTDPVLGPLLEPRPLATTFLFVASRLLRVLLPGRLRVSGLDRLPDRGPYIISPNHQSYLDPFYVCSVLPRRAFRDLFFVGAVEYFETPFMQRLSRLVNCVPVDPDSNLVPAMQASAFGLSHGKVLVLFPEGERSIDGTVKRFKKGAPILARHLEAPIVPVALKGVYEIWPRNRALNWKAWWPWSGHTVRVVFGEPMRVGKEEDYAAAAERLRRTVEGMWQQV
jgi:long-chain acyl-CoA synthetase